MNFFQALAVLCLAFLAAALVWRANCFFRRCAIGGKKTRVTVVVSSDGNAGELEQSVRGLLRLISNNTLDANTGIVIKNSGITGETQEMARILERDYPSVSVVE
jgi:hypothetical protein